MEEHNFSVRKLNEFSVLHNKAIHILNKPKDIKNEATGFEITNEERYIRRK